MALTLIVSASWLFAIDSLVKNTIEKRGTRIIGAKVELDSADVSLFPAGLTLKGLQVTNPDKPMQNTVEIAQVLLSLDALKLFLNKIIVNEMTLTGVKLNTSRKTSGALFDIPASPAEAEKATAAKETASRKTELPSFRLPNAEEILKKEELASTMLVESINDEIKTKKESWKNQLAQLTDKEKLKDYKARFKKLKSIRLENIFSGAKDIVSLKNELSQDIKQIKSARKNLKADLDSLKKQIKEADDLAKQDINRLKTKYALTPAGLSNTSKLLLGEKITGYAETGIKWYKIIQPYLVKSKKDKKTQTKPERGKGIDVHFKDIIPLPDLLIRKTLASVTVPFGTLSGEINHITRQQEVLGKPLTFNFSGDNAENIHSIDLDGKLDRTVPAENKDIFNLKVKEYKAQNITLSKKTQWPINLQEGSADLNLEASISGENITANLNAILTSLKATVEAKDKENPIAKTLNSTLASIKAFSLQADVKGTLDNYDVQLKSDLDRILKDSVDTLVQEQAKSLEKELEEEIMKKVGISLDKLKLNLNGLEAVDLDLNNRLKDLSGLL